MRPATLRTRTQRADISRLQVVTTVQPLFEASDHGTRFAGPRLLDPAQRNAPVPPPLPARGWHRNSLLRTRQRCSHWCEPSRPFDANPAAVTRPFPDPRRRQANAVRCNCPPQQQAWVAAHDPKRPRIRPVARPAAPSVVGPPRPTASESWFPAEGGAGACWI